jgi:histidine triad (HIT) family protein
VSQRECLFCRLYAEGDHVRKQGGFAAVRDINPKAPTHLLVIPRRHVESLMALESGDDDLVGAMVRKARDLARELGLGERGFRLVFNCGDDAGYSVYHIHLHLLGGRKLGWPPG